MKRAVFLSLFALAALGGCSAGPLGPVGTGSGFAPGPGAAANTRADQATQLACRNRANQMYDRRNRAEIYSPHSSINTPFSANYEPGTTDRALGDRFAFDRMVDECVRNSGTGAERPVAPAPAPAPSTRGR